MESIALQRMMKEILGDHEAIIVEVSQSEKLEKIFTLAIPKRSAFMMARINSYPLFNKLFNAKAKTPKEAYAILKKPLWLSIIKVVKCKTGRCLSKRYLES